MATVTVQTVPLKTLQSTLQTLTDGAATIIAVTPLNTKQVIVASKV